MISLSPPRMLLFTRRFRCRRQRSALTVVSNADTLGVTSVPSTAGLAIYDTMRFVKCDVATYCLGQAASMGSLLLAAGTKGKRYALPNARVMIHQPWGGTQGTAADIHIQAKEILKLREQLNGILAHHTGKSIEQIEKDTDRDYFMSAEEAKNYGIVDQVITTRMEVPKS